MYDKLDVFYKALQEHFQMRGRLTGDGEFTLAEEVRFYHLYAEQHGDPLEDFPEHREAFLTHPERRRPNGGPAWVYSATMSRGRND